MIRRTSRAVTPSRLDLAMKERSIFSEFTGKELRTRSSSSRAKSSSAIGDPELLQLPQRREGDVGLLHRRSTRYLQVKSCAAGPDWLSGSTPSAQLRVVELARRQVTDMQARSTPMKVAQRQLAHTIRDLQDEARVLATWMNRPDTTRPRSGCCQRTSASVPGDLAASRVDDRLVWTRSRRGKRAGASRLPARGARGPQASPR